MLSVFKSVVIAGALLVAPAMVFAGEHAEGEPKATAYGVGSTVEDFSLAKAADGEKASLSSLAGEHGVALVFWNQSCPYVQEAQDRIAEFHKAYADKGIKVVAVDAGTNNSAESIKTYADKMPFTFLVNDNSQIAAQFGATRTPEVFLIDKNQVVRYHGAFDNGRLQGENAVREAFLQKAADSLLAGQDLSVKETKAFGCTLKYAQGVSALPRSTTATADSDEAKQSS